MTIVLAGGSGFLGRALRTHFLGAGHAVRTLTRRPPTSHTEVTWRPDGTVGHWAASLDDADVIVNLAGEGIADKRWTTARKERLRASRILPTRSLTRALEKAVPRPRIVITSSAIGYYGAHGDEPVTEDTPAGRDFLAALSVDWEHEARAAASSTTTVVLVRTGIVLGPDGGALKPLLLPFRLGLGGPLGSGRQYWSWIHLADWVALVAWLADSARAVRQPPAPGPAPVSVWNATAPNPVANAEFARTLGRVLRRPAMLPAPAFALRLMLGEFAEMLTTGARVLPVAAERAGFRFRYPDLEPALVSLLAPL